MNKLIKLESEWRKGTSMRWQFQRVTRIRCFEARGGSPDDRITSIQVGPDELLVDDIPVALIIGGNVAMMYPAMPVGVTIIVRTTSNSLELRPVGEQVQ